MTKKFRIWDKDGKAETYSADRVEFKRKGNGLEITLYTGKTKRPKIKEAVCMIELPESKPKPMQSSGVLMSPASIEGGA